jgi:hypothetical protein
MWNQIDEFIRIRNGNRISRSAFFEELFRQEQEAAKNDVRVQPGETISASTAKSLINRIKDFVHDNAQNKNIVNLEAIRRQLDELNHFNNEEIRRSRTKTKSDKRQEELVRALMANKARIDSNGDVVIDAPLKDQPVIEPSPNRLNDIPPKEEESQGQGQKQQEQQPDPVDLEYEKMVKDAKAQYEVKEPPLPKSDIPIIDEGKTKRNPFDKSGSEEVFE